MKYIITMSDVGRDIDDIIKGLKKKDKLFVDPNIIDCCFGQFWNSGIRKANKKKAKSIFINILKKQKEPVAFTDQLCDDVAQRLNLNQLGFAQMHPTTYLNGERWLDELKQGEPTNGQAKTNGSANKPSLIEQARTACSNFEQRSIRQDIEPLLVSDD